MSCLSTNFNRAEFACKCGCGFDTIDAELIKVLQELRDYFCKSVTITSGCRCKTYSKAVGGTETSQHPKGRAADIIVKDTPSKDVYKYLNEKYPDQYGLGSYDDFTHIDTRNEKRRW